jgi:hypothetical protein
VLLNVVNTVGEYVLSKNVVKAAAAAVASGHAANKAEFIGSFYGVYGMIAAGASFAITRWLKTAENAGDYQWG